MRHEVLAMGANDPRSAQELVAARADDSAGLLVVSARERRRSLRPAWVGDDAGTGEMRAVVQPYRTFWSCLEGFSREI